MSAGHALITGGSSGIGRALGRQLMSRGYDVSMIARRKALLEAAAAELRSCAKHSKQRVEIYQADVSDQTQAEAATKEAIDHLGNPDLVVTSAGTAVPGYFGDISASSFRNAMEVNYFGTLYVIRAALPSMLAHKKGRIVLISSGAALMGIFGYASYGPSKFAVRGLAETLRSELRLSNVGVSVAYPPDTETPMLEEENKTKPEETKRITGLVKAWTADAVAASILRGVDRRSFSITPGLTLTLMHRLPGIMIPLLSWYSDRLVDGVQRACVTPPAMQAKTIGS